jgi:hypothetical protein
VSDNVREFHVSKVTVKAVDEGGQRFVRLTVRNKAIGTWNVDWPALTAVGIGQALIDMAAESPHA